MTYALIAGVVVIILVLAVVAATFHRPAATTTSADTLAPVGWAVVTLGVDQFADIPFTIGAAENLTGAYETENTITTYVMNQTDFAVLVNKDVVVGYQWTSGQVWHGNISDTLPAGTWNLVFFDSNQYGSSGVAITQAVVLSPT